MVRESYEYSTLDEARADACTALVMEGGYGGQTYLTCPLSSVRCTLENLRQLLDELNSLAWGCDGERLYFEHEPANGSASLWLHPDFEQLNLKSAVEQILSGITPWIEVPSAFEQLRRLGRNVPLVAGSVPAEPRRTLFYAAAADDAELVHALVGRSDVNAIDEEGWTALLWAAAQGMPSPARSHARRSR